MENIHELKHPLLATSPGKGPLQAGMAGPTTAPDPSGPPSSRHMPPPFSWLQPGSAALAHQLLDPSNLERTVEPYQTPEAALHPELWKASALQGWKKKDYIETAFGDSKEAGELPRKVGLEKDIRTVCYEVGDTELPDLENDSSTDSDTESESSFSALLPQDYLGLAVFSMLCCFWPLGIAAFYLSQKTNKASAKGDYPEAWTASRQTFALAVLSIILGICTYIGAVVALIAYLSNKAPT